MKKEITINLEFWSVENTGWSGGVSWFATGGTEMNPLRFRTEQEATDFALRNKKHYNDPQMLWRTVHTLIEKTKSKRVTTEKYNEV